MKRVHVAAALAALTYCAAAGAQFYPQQRGYTPVPPPPPARYEPAPAPRPGYAWEAGRHEWQRDHYVWLPGRWIAVQARYDREPDYGRAPRDYEIERDQQRYERERERREYEAQQRERARRLERILRNNGDPGDINVD